MIFFGSWGKQTRPVQQGIYASSSSFPSSHSNPFSPPGFVLLMHSSGRLPDSRQNLQVQMVRWKFLLCSTNFSPPVKAGRCFAGATFNRVFILLTFIYLHTGRSVFYATNTTSSATVNVRPWWGQDDGHRGAWKWLSLNNLTTCFMTAVPPFSVFQSQLWQPWFWAPTSPQTFVPRDSHPICKERGWAVWRAD